VNPNWTGRSARSLSECRFWDADPIEHGPARASSADIWLAVAIGIGLAAALVAWWSS